MLPAQEIPIDEYQSKFRQTHPGQAHLAGTGPAHATCRQCAHFSSDSYYSKGGKHGGQLKPGECRKYTEMMRASGPRVPHYANACRHFDLSNSIPEAMQK
jgi:hypothetical protein